MVISKRDNLGDVFQCGCGVIHINLEGISLRFPPETFIQLASMIYEASSKLMDESLNRLIKNSEEDI